MVVTTTKKAPIMKSKPVYQNTILESFYEEDMDNLELNGDEYGYLKTDSPQLPRRVSPV